MTFYNFLGVIVKISLNKKGFFFPFSLIDDFTPLPVLGGFAHDKAL